MGGRAEKSVLSSPTCSGIVANTGMSRAFEWKNGTYSLESRLHGGEGGIRTLGTGVSPYNGLAIISADVMRSNLNHLQSCSSTKTPLM